MTNTEGFHRSFAIAADKDSPHWQQELDLNTDQAVSHFMATISNATLVPKSAVNDLLSLEINITALMEDIFELKGNGIIPVATANVLQFWFATILVTAMSESKLDNRCFQWLNNALDHQISDDEYREMDFGRLADLLAIQEGILGEMVGRQLFPWLTELFVYSKRNGGLFNSCQKIIVELLPFILKKAIENPNQGATEMLIHISAWCSQYNRHELEIVNHALVEIFSNAQDRQIQKSIAFQFSVSGKSIGGETRQEWIKATLESYSDLLKQHDRSQLLILQHSHSIDELLKHLDEIKSAIREYVDNLNLGSDIMDDYHIGHIYKIVQPAIMCLVINGHIAQANQLIASYYKIKETELITPDNLFIIPNYATGIIYAFRGGVLTHTHQGAEEVFKELLETRSRFNGTNLRLLDDPNFPQREHRIYGKPDDKEGPKFEKLLKDYFNFSNLLYIPGITEANGISLIYDIYLPIQNIISLTIGRTLPIKRNFTQPLPARALKKVFIWLSYGTTTSELSATALKEIFEDRSIDVVIITDTESTKEEFLQHFRSSEYDVFWILSHGEYQHYEPHSSYLDLGSNVKISVQELKENNFRGKDRRLLVMDLCDSTTAHMNSQVSIGLGTSVSHACQSVIGYSWPVDPHVSFQLGIIMATFLVDSQTYAEAHYNTIHTFMQGKDAIITRLKMFISNPELFERIENKHIEYENFANWGIVTYLE